MAVEEVRERVRPLTAREVGELLGYSPDTVKGIPSADLPYFRNGDRGHRRYDRRDVEAYIARRRVG